MRSGSDGVNEIAMLRGRGSVVRQREQMNIIKSKKQKFNWVAVVGGGNNNNKHEEMNNNKNFELH